MKLSPAKLAPYLIAVIVTGLVCALSIYERTHPDFAAVRKLEWITYDARVRLASRVDAPVATNLGAVFIDDQSIAEMNQQRQVTFPWPRNLYGQMVDELTLHGARVIGMDILFAESHPQSIVRTASGEALYTDDVFAESLRKASNVVLAADQGLYPHSHFFTNTLAVGDISAESDRDTVLRRVKPYRTYRVWHRALADFASDPELQLDLSTAVVRDGKLVIKQPASGEAVEIPLDSAGNVELKDVFENVTKYGEPTLVKPFVDTRTWHMGVWLASRSLGLDLKQAVVETRRIILRGAAGVERIIPLDEEGFMHIDWYLKQDDRRLKTVSFMTVWNEAAKRQQGQPVDPKWADMWKDSVVILGSTATGNNVSDMGGTPLDKQTYLVSKHWNVANSIITGQFIQRSSELMELFLIAALGLSSAWVTWRLRAPWPTLWVVLAAAVYVGVAFLLFVQQRYWLPIVLPVVGAMFANHLSAEVYRVVFEQKEKRRVKSVFAKLVSPNIVDEMLKSEQINLGGSRRQITVFFADVRGFTSMTDEYAAKAEEYVRTHHLEGDAAEAYYNQQAAITLDTVNMYLSAIADKVKEHKGTLDKYMGDCVMAFWGMPTLNPQHALFCVRAAIDAQRAMGALNQKRFEENKLIEAENLERQKRGEEPKQLNTLLALGTGINTGYAIIGLMGSERHILNYTVFGREVNIASRLEGVSGRGRIIIGEATYSDILRDDPTLAATCSELEPVLVKGIKKPVRIFEVPWKQEEEKMLEPTTDAASTGFFRLEKDTVMIPKPSSPSPAEKPQTTEPQKPI